MQLGYIISSALPNELWKQTNYYNWCTFRIDQQKAFDAKDRG